MTVPRLHLISNRALSSVDRFPAVAKTAVAGGVDAVHVREPDLDAGQFRILVERTTNALSETGARIIVNRFVDIAIDLDVGGLQLAEAQLDELASFRAAIPEKMLVGVSVHSLESAVQAESAGADYVLAGHIFETGSKPGTPGRGLDYVSAVSEAVSIPVIGIGGITPGNAASVVRAGAWGVAVMSAILASPVPDETAKRFRSALEMMEDK